LPGNALPSLKSTLPQLTTQNLPDTRCVSSCFLGTSRNVNGKLTYRSRPGCLTYG